MLQPFFNYFGGKWRAVPHYPVPIHDTIIEPFAGSAGYSLYHPSRQVVLIEKNVRIAALWAYLISATSAQILSLPLKVPNSTNDLDIDLAERDLIGFWLNKGSAMPGKTASSWMRGNTCPTSFWGKTIRNRIATQVEQIKHWQIICGDYALAPDIKATWFIDPPYQKAGIVYKETAKNLDFSQLGEWCRTRKGQVIVCENVGATWLPFTAHKTIKGTSGPHRNNLSHEAIWTNTKIGFFS